MAKTLKTSQPINLPSLHYNMYFLTDTTLNYIRYFFCIILAYSFCLIKNRQHVREVILYKLYLSLNGYRTYKISRFSRICQALFIWICIINFMLITIINPSMLNPGPTNTKKLHLTLFTIKMYRGLSHLVNSPRNILLSIQLNSMK